MMEMDQLEGRFYEYMHHLDQVDEDWNREVLEFYVPYFAHCHRVLDVGCGQGQFIELLKAEGVATAGIDVDARMVEVCREKGFDVLRADLFDYLPGQKDQFDGIFSSNLIEHLRAQEALRFLQVAFEALHPGGVLLVATPNSESLIVHLYEFWRDPTHVRLYSRWVLEFLFHYVGFRDVVGGVNPQTAWELPSGLRDLPAHLEGLPTRPQDLSPVPRLSMISVLAPPVIEGNRTPVQRLFFRLRRRLARFLTHTVLFEELIALDHKLAFLERALIEQGETLSKTIDEQAADLRTAVRVLHDSTLMLYPPREVFVKGVKPSG